VTGAGIPCAGCGDGWTAHEPPDQLGPGPCTAAGCPCNGFRWLDPAVEPAGYPRGAPDDQLGRDLRRLEVLMTAADHRRRRR
jgi:hypothetical protein